MADNTISSSLQENIVIGATEALSESMALLQGVQMNASPDPGNKGESFNVGEYASRSASDVTANNVSPDGTAATLGAATITLGNHKKANFKLTGREFQGQNLDATVRSQIQECVRAVVYDINASLHALYYKVPFLAGDASRSIFNDGSTASLSGLADLGKVLNDNRTDQSKWKLVVSTTEEANAKKVATLQQANTFGSRDVVLNGYVGRAMGFDIFMDQQCTTHTTGTITTGLTTKSGSTQAIGTTSLVCTTAASTGAVALKQGDCITINSEYYSLTADATEASASTDVTLSLDHGLTTATTGGDAVTLTTGHGSGVIGLAGDFSGFGLVNRIEATDFYGTGTLENRMIVTHPSGLSLSLGTYKQYHQALFEASALWGVQVVDYRKLARALGA